MNERLPGWLGLCRESRRLLMGVAGEGKWGDGDEKREQVLTVPVGREVWGVAEVFGVWQRCLGLGFRLGWRGGEVFACC